MNKPFSASIYRAGCRFWGGAMSCTSLSEAAYGRFCRRQNCKSIAPYRSTAGHTCRLSFGW